MKLVVCFISPRQRLGDIKTYNSFHKYRMKWKFISDPIYMYMYKILWTFDAMMWHNDTADETSRQSWKTWFETNITMLHNKLIINMNHVRNALSTLCVTIHVFHFEGLLSWDIFHNKYYIHNCSAHHLHLDKQRNEHHSLLFLFSSNFNF